MAGRYARRKVGSTPQQSSTATPVIAMRIEVATPTSSSAKDKGDLLERVAADVLSRHNYEVVSEMRRTASELDLDCRHKVSQRRIYVECKAHREPLSAGELTKLLGNVTFHQYAEGWLISTGPLGKDAKGFQHDWEQRPQEQRETLSVYTPDRIVELLCGADIIRPQPVGLALQLVIDEGAIGEWTLLITGVGIFWCVVLLESRVPSAVLVFDAYSSIRVTDSALLRTLSETDATIANLSFEIADSATSLKDDHTRLRANRVVEVESGIDWSDYRPARPEHFIGRADAQNRILTLLRTVRTGGDRTRVFAITGDSGMGKSSLVTKLRDRCRNIRNRNSFFMYAVDVRAATGQGYIASALLAALSEAAKSGYGDPSAGKLRVTDHADPLSSPSIEGYLRSLETTGQVVCIVFDQFEELYSKPELFSVFEEAQSLFVATIAACSNLCLGFAWKTDSTVQQGHPAYFMWHSLADHRLEVTLSPFSHKDASAALTLFEREIKTKIRPELRRQVIEISQGFPWLIKKLCVHLWENLQAGVSQEGLADTLQVSALFDRDLQTLSTAENGCLKAIARGAPADWYEILEAYGEEVLRALQQKRLVVRSGDRVNLY